MGLLGGGYLSDGWGGGREGIGLCLLLLLRCLRLTLLRRRGLLMEEGLGRGDRFRGNLLLRLRDLRGQSLGWEMFRIDRVELDECIVVYSREQLNIQDRLYN